MTSESFHGKEAIAGPMENKLVISRICSFNIKVIPLVLGCASDSGNNLDIELAPGYNYNIPYDTYMGLADDHGHGGYNLDNHHGHGHLYSHGHSPDHVQGQQVGVVEGVAHLPTAADGGGGGVTLQVGVGVEVLLQAGVGVTHPPCQQQQPRCGCIIHLQIG